MKVGVVGLGLIGGSIALGLRAAHEVRGHDADPRARELARGAGLAVTDELAGLLPSDAVIVATPLAAIVPVLEGLVAVAGDAVLVEVGSVKAPVAAFADRAPDGARIVGLHPMAGTTASGFAAADPAIFSGRPFLVVPTSRSDGDAMAVAGDLSRALGGVVTVCSPAVHDGAVAMLSGVPLAAALALAKAGADVAEWAGPGFRDATRLAATPADLARGLLHGNREHVRAALARYRAALDEVEREL